jgi:hypothetical protein
MGVKKEGRGAKPGETAETKQPEKPKRPRNKAALVKHVIRKITSKLENDELKPTVGDFIRLLQLEKELAEETPREIKVTWVEPEKENAPEE